MHIQCVCTHIKEIKKRKKKKENEKSYLAEKCKVEQTEGSKALIETSDRMYYIHFTSPI